MHNCNGSADLLARCQATWLAQPAEAAAVVNGVWKRIDSTILSSSSSDLSAPAPAPASPTPRRRRAWPTVSVFVSSALADFADERDRLSRHVFPDLRDWCEARRLALDECDPRCGLAPGDSDRAHLDLLGQAGGCCVFLGLVGHRLGPEVSETELAATGLPAGCSTDLAEALSCGALDPSSRRCAAALFLLLMDDDSNDDGGAATAQAARYRLEIASRLPASRVLQYSRSAADSLDSFEACVLEQLKRVVSEQFPSATAPFDVTLTTEISDSNEAHIGYLQSLLETDSHTPATIAGQERCLSLLTNFVETGELSMADFHLFGDSADHIAFGLPGVKSVVVSGDPGAGKSTMLARLGAAFLDRRGFDVLAHFAQLSPASNDRRTLQRKMKAFLRGQLTEAEAARLGDEQATRSVSELFNSIMSAKRTMLILIDAFECFYEVSHVGELLPVAWPQNIRCVVSCRRRDLDRCFSERSVCLYELQPLEPAAQALVCRGRLGEDWSSELADALLGVRAGSGAAAPAAAANPLWLVEACGEVRRSGPAAAAGLPGGARDLLLSVATRLLAEEDADGSLAALLALACVARVGLWERHVRLLLRFVVEYRAASPTEASEVSPPTLSLQPLPLTDYRRLLRLARPFLRHIRRESSALAYRHELARSAAAQALQLVDSPERAKRWHSLAVDFILLAERLGFGCAYLARDLPFHLYWSDRRSELHALLQAGGGSPVSGSPQHRSRVPHQTASGVYSSWRCRVPKVAADKSQPVASASGSAPRGLVACLECAEQPGANAERQPRVRCCIYCGQALAMSRAGGAVPALTCGQHLAPPDEQPRCWFCSSAAGAQPAQLLVCNFCNSAASSYLCYLPVLETDPQFSQVVRNQTKKFGLQW
ncbi:hypothetical protein BOX15_Mlig034231g2 [Macrostomum lignano]|uniref:NACHT domain-containing protein n=1 Tax=Macrostomum lignano TaxID=282301 RepID=A0A267E5T6_9PLAT|nr:hypothetical protein BOX15_Mlig034231g1 [Macrostomum lignano]PAA78975.1 hypothetical protein BOX15_Mlig034231g2 [Macrostomum lignano]